MSSQKPIRDRSSTAHAERVQFCSRFGSTPAVGESISINGQTFVPDRFTAFVEFHLCHALPVVTSDNGGFYPQVVANSYRSMLHKVFNLGHLMKAYDPARNSRDRILGTIVGVEFPEMPAGGWLVQADKDKAPGIRAVACMHRQAEQVEEILYTWFTGNVGWSVSLEQRFYPDESGLVVRGRKGVESYEASTPEDLRRLGFVYVGYTDACQGLRGCLTKEENAVARDFQGQEVVLLPGGLAGTIAFKGAGLCPDGTEREAEAKVTQMLAAKKLLDLTELPMADTLALAARTFGKP